LGDVCKNRSPYAIGPLSVLSVCLSVLSVTLVHCGQTVACIKMKLGVQVSLGPGHIVLDGDAAPPPPKGHSPPIFGPYLLWPNGCMDQDATWYGGRPWTRRLFVGWGPSSPREKGTPTPPNLWPLSVVTKRLNGSRCHLVQR